MFLTFKLEFIGSNGRCSVNSKAERVKIDNPLIVSEPFSFVPFRNTSRPFNLEIHKTFKGVPKSEHHSLVNLSSITSQHQWLSTLARFTDQEFNRDVTTEVLRITEVYSPFEPWVSFSLSWLWKHTAMFVLFRECSTLPAKHRRSGKFRKKLIFFRAAPKREKERGP